MRRLARSVALGLGVLIGCAVAFAGAFTPVGEAGEALVILAVVALLRGTRETGDQLREDRARRRLVSRFQASLRRSVTMPNRVLEDRQSSASDPAPDGSTLQGFLDQLQ